MTPSARPRSLWPKEHGAYAQLLVPLLTASLLAQASQDSLLWGLAGCLIFVAHESGLVLLGRRGRRAQQEAGPRARRWFLALMGAASLALAAVLVPEPGRAWAIAPSMFAGLLAVVFVAFRAEKSAPGEAVAAVALAGVAYPAAVMGGVSAAQAGLLWLAWGLGFVCVTGGVRGVIHQHRGRSEVWTWPMLGVGGAGCIAGGIFAPVLWCALPLVLGAWGLQLVGPSARHLRRIGVGLVGAAMLTGGLMVGLVR